MCFGSLSMGRFRACLSIWVAGAMGLLLAPSLPAHEMVESSPANARWDIPTTSSVATFLGKDEIEVAVLLLKKAETMGAEIVIQSDAPTISFSSGDSVKVSFSVKPEKEGAISHVKFVGGDQPTISIEGKEDIRQRGKWIQVVKAAAKELKVELSGATFATVTLPGKSGPAKPTPVAASQPVEDPKGGALPAKKVTPAKLHATAIAFSNGVSHKCERCDGSGKVTKSVKTGSVKQGAIIRPTYSNVTQSCDTCDGKGSVRARDDLLNRLAGNFLLSLAGLDESDPKAQAAVSDAYKVITDRMIGDYKTWELLTENGRSILSQRNPTAGTPVIAKCIVKRSLPLKNGKRQYLVKIGGTDKLVVISDPVSADEVKSGPALIGGMVEPPDTKKEGEKEAVAVLEQGFLVAPPVQRSWYWWYWWEKE